MKEEIGEGLAISWRYFSLEQVNSQQGPDWKIWEQPPEYPSRGMGAFRSAEAARRQGEAAFESFHFALLKARHEERLDIADTNTLNDVAAGVNLDMTRFHKDFNDSRILDSLARDHTLAVEKLGVFGTPTLVFPGGQAVFLKMLPPPPPDESINLFKQLRQLAEQRPYIHEVKRSEPPESER